MTREEAIEVIEQDIPCEHDTDLIEALEMAIKALEQEPKWIPVSERLPEEKGVYLVARKNKGFGGKGSFTNHISINVRGYTGGTSRWGKDQCGIVAWMPLPKPYEPQERTDKE